MPLRQLVLILAIAGAFGVLVPYFKGPGFLDRRLIIAYACLAAVIAGPSAADAIAAEDGGVRLGKVVRVWLISWAFGLCLLALALVTVNLTSRHRSLLAPRTGFLAAAECLSLTTSAAAAFLGAMLTSRLSAPSAKAAFRTVFLVLIAAFFLADRYLTISLTTAALTRLLYIVSAVFGGAALAMCYGGYRKPR